MGYKNMSASKEDIVKLTASQNSVILTYNKEVREMDMHIDKLLYWKSEVTGEDDEERVKTETVGANENTESNPETNMEEEMDIETNEEDEISTHPISPEGVEMRYKWYDFSDMFVTEEYKLQYIQPNAEAANRKKIFAWYDACCRIDLVPDEFKVDEEKESKEETEFTEENESEEENKQSQKKSFRKKKKKKKKSPPKKKKKKKKKK